MQIGFPKVIPKKILSRDHTVSCCVLGKQKYFLMKRASVLRKMNQCERYLAIFAHGEYGPNVAQTWPKRFVVGLPRIPKIAPLKVSLTRSLTTLMTFAIVVQARLGFISYCETNGGDQCDQIRRI